jgi:hypothetical protein
LETQLSSASTVCHWSTLFPLQTLLHAGPFFLLPLQPSLTASRLYERPAEMHVSPAGNPPVCLDGPSSLCPRAARILRRNRRLRGRVEHARSSSLSFCSAQCTPKMARSRIVARPASQQASNPSGQRSAEAAQEVVSKPPGKATTDERWGSLAHPEQSQPRWRSSRTRLWGEPVAARAAGRAPSG